MQTRSIEGWGRVRLTLRPVYQVHLLLLTVLLGAVGTTDVGGKTPNIFWADLVLIVLIGRWFYTRGKVRLTGLEIWMTVHIATVFLSLMLAVDLPHSLAIAKLHFMPLTLFILMRDSIRNEDDIWKALWALAGFGAVLSCMILYNWHLYSLGLKVAEFGGVKEWAQVAWGRNNLLGGLLIMAVAALFPFLMARTLWMKTVAYGAMVLMLVAIAITMSRGAMLSLAMGVILWLGAYVTRRQRGLMIILDLLRILIFIVAIGIIGWLLVPPGVRDHLFYVFKVLLTQIGSDPESNDRIQKLTVAWYVISSNPIFGIGVGNQNTLVFYGGSAHNLIVETLLETGLIGTVPLVIALWKIFREGIACWKLEARGGLRIGSFALVFLGGSFVDNCIEPHFWGVQYAYAFWIGVALIFSARRIVKT